jgi:uncharacterized membrane protein YhaH (DUF805 family)
MINFLRAFCVLLLTIAVSGCSFLSNTMEYNGTAKEFGNALMREDYNRCIELMPVDSHSHFYSRDTLLHGMAALRKKIVSNFGTELNFTFAGTKKNLFSINANRPPANLTPLEMQIDNGQHFGLLHFEFDDNSRKIAHVRIQAFKSVIPPMWLFWLVGIFAVGVLVFNIYTMVRIRRRRDIRRKWLKYLAIVFLNAPVVVYTAMGNLSLKLLTVTFFGLGFGLTGYLGSVWQIGIPIAALYWTWYMRQRDDVTVEQSIKDDSTPFVS